jgi:hypothetical protein
MKKLIKFRAASGPDVLIEVDEDAEGMGQVGREDHVADLTQETFERAMSGIRPITDRIMSTLRDLNNPEELALQFGIKLSAEAGVILASASAEANISVTMKWKND